MRESNFAAKAALRIRCAFGGFSVRFALPWNGAAFSKK